MLASTVPRWDAYVMERDLVLLGTYTTKRAAVAARAKYWKAKKAGTRRTAREEFFRLGLSPGLR
jgi:hypothetical protein